MPEIAVIGGGIAGCETALELANKGHKVIIYEQESDILQGTSARTPGRMGLGYHYFHTDTALRYMRQTVEFMKHYSDCLIGNKSNPHLMHGRYFIVKDSLVDPQDLRAMYGEIAKDFRKMCAEDSTNKIFGEQTSNLHEYLYKKDYESDVNHAIVDTAIETEERLLDWQKFSEKLKSEITNHPNIEIRTRSTISDLSIDENGKFLVNRGDAEHKFDYVVNCTWQNIEALNEKFDIGDSNLKKDDPNQVITSRLKLLAEVDLPESLKEKHSMFFCVGPHAMFTNLGNGKGRITFAPVTNFGTTTETQMPEQWQRWLSEGLSPEETQEYGQKIIDGVAQYIPAMKDAKLAEVIAGIVKSKGLVNIKDKDSDFHKRDYSGVEEEEFGWINNAAMKLFYCLGNAKEVLEIITKQEAAKVKMQKMIKSVIDFAYPDQSDQQDLEKKIHQKTLGQFFTPYLQKNFKFKSEDFEEGREEKLTEDLKCTAEKKGLVIREITQLAPKIKQKNGITIE